MPQEAGRRAFLQFAAAAGGAALLSACTGNGTPQSAGDSATRAMSVRTADRSGRWVNVSPMIMTRPAREST